MKTLLLAISVFAVGCASQAPRMMAPEDHLQYQLQQALAADVVVAPDEIPRARGRQCHQTAGAVTWCYYTSAPLKN